MKKKCKQCNKVLKLIPNGHQKKFCNITCRNRFLYVTKDLKQWQRDYKQKLDIAKYGKKNLIKCLICGYYFRQLGSHVTQVHKITALEYRKQFGFDLHETGNTLIVPLKKLYGEQAMENGTYKNLKKGAHRRFVKGDKRAGRYERSLETMCRLKRQVYEIE